MSTHHATAAPTLVGDFSLRDSRDVTIIARGGGALLLASAFGNGLNYVFGIFLARMLGAEEFGLYALALTIFNMISLTVVFGLDTGATKFISHHLAEGQQAKARSTIIAATSLAIGSGLIAAIGLGLLAHPIAVTLYHKPELALSLMCFAAAIPLTTLSSVVLSTLQAYRTVRYTILIKYLWEPISKFLLTGLLILAGFQLLGVLVSIVLALAVGTLLAIYALYRLVFTGLIGHSMWNFSEARPLLGYCFPLVISNIFGVMAPRSDILILGYWANAQDVGIYLAAFQTAAIISLVLSAFTAGSAPIISHAWSQGDRARMRDVYQAVSRLAITVSLPIFCGFIVFARQILEVFGSDFSAGSTALMLLALGQLFNNATGSANTLLLMSGHSRLVMTNTIIMGIVLLAATAAIIPLGGITGAALAASTVFILTNLIRMIQVWRVHRVQPYTWALAKPIAAAMIATGIVFVLHELVPTVPISLLGVTIGILYLSGLLLLGIHRQDRLILQSLFSKFGCFFEKQ